MSKAKSVPQDRAPRPRLPERKVVDISRRQMLIGMGGATLALPFLPSLVRSQVVDPVFTRQPRMFWLTTDHGGAFEASMFPSRSMLTSTANIYSDHTASYGELTPTMDGGDAVLSPRKQLGPRSPAANTLRRHPRHDCGQSSGGRYPPVPRRAHQIKNPGAFAPGSWEENCGSA